MTSQEYETRIEESAAPARIGGGRLVISGLVAGAVAGMVMAMWTMFAGFTWGNFGVFTPMYLIAAPFTGTEEVRNALAATQAGDFWWWDTGPALVGAAIHMGWSMMWGVVFGLLARWTRLPRINALVVGMVFGFAVMLLMDWITLPLTEEIFGGAPYVTDLPNIIGWATWTIGHLMFGLVVGLWAAMKPQQLGAPPGE